MIFSANTRIGSAGTSSLILLAPALPIFSRFARFAQSLSRPCATAATVGESSQKTGHSVNNDFRMSPDVSREDGSTAKHRFDYGQRQSFAAGWHHQDVIRSPDVLQSSLHIRQKSRAWTIRNAQQVSRANFASALYRTRLNANCGSPKRNSRGLQTIYLDLYGQDTIWPTHARRNSLSDPKAGQAGDELKSTLYGFRITSAFGKSKPICFSVRRRFASETK